MKGLPLPLIAVLALSACNHAPDNSAYAPSADHAVSKKLLEVTVGGKKGWIDRTGRIIVNPQYDSAFDFSEGLALVCVGPCDQDHFQGFRYTKGLETEALEQTFKYGYVDESGKMVINPMFESAEIFSDGLAGICIGHGCYYSRPSDKPKEEGKWGFIDKTGAVTIPPQFTYVSTFHEGLAAVSVGGKWGYIDKTGRFVINPQFDSASDFENGLAQVGLKVAKADSVSKQYLDDNGNPVPGAPEPAGRELVDKYQYGYIDRDGKYIWQPSN
jgi:hypothetical protein